MSNTPNESVAPSVTITRVLEKFDGEYVPGMQPVETLTSSETIPLEEFLARLSED